MCANLYDSLYIANSESIQPNCSTLLIFSNNLVKLAGGKIVWENVTRQQGRGFVSFTVLQPCSGTGYKSAALQGAGMGGG